MKMYGRRHWKREFMRVLKANENKKTNTSTTNDPAFDKFNTAISAIIVATIFVGIIFIGIWYYVTIACIIAFVVEIIIGIVVALISGAKEAVGHTKMTLLTKLLLFIGIGVLITFIVSFAVAQSALKEDLIDWKKIDICDNFIKISLILLCVWIIGFPIIQIVRANIGWQREINNSATQDETISLPRDSVSDFKNQIKDTKDIDTAKTDKQTPKISRLTVGILVFIVALIITIVCILCYNANEEEKLKCAISKCTYNKTENSNFCHHHTCAIADCYNYRDSEKIYCYTHSTTPLSQITVVNPTTELDDRFSIISYCYYRAKFKDASENQIFYAVLTIYDDENDIIYRNYEWLQKKKYDIPSASIRVPLSYHRKCAQYEWTVFRAAPSKINAD